VSRKTHAPSTRATARETECHCGGGLAHPWKPDGSGTRMLACPSTGPIRAQIGRRRR
jgi:hypothetical protein